MQLTPRLAVEKVLYRLALMHEGSVSIARGFIELPLSLEEFEQHADQVADGRSVVRNDYGEFLRYDFPELQRQSPLAPDDCPICFGEAPSSSTAAGVEQRAPLVCATCYRSLQRIQRTQPDETTWAKLSHFFRGEEEEQDLGQVARIEHEIFFLGLRSGLAQFTHTTIAAQSRLPGDQIKERLDRMGARRYLKVGLLPSGDAVAYSAPMELSYPGPLYERLTGQATRPPSRRVELRVDLKDEVVESPNSWPSVRTAPRTPAPLPAEPAPAPKPAPQIEITIKSRRDRPPR